MAEQLNPKLISVPVLIVGRILQPKYFHFKNLKVGVSIA